jgi:hypothetical protein
MVLTPTNAPLELPAWHGPITRLARESIAAIRVIAAATAENLPTERARVTASFRRGEPTVPVLLYRAVDHSARRDVLHRAATAIENDGILGALYAERLLELDGEAALTAAVGTRLFGPLARRRFPARAEDADGIDADRDREVLSAGPDTTSDGTRGETLFTCVLQRLQRHGVDVPIVFREDLSALAATGDDRIYLARGRRLSTLAARRTAVHEVDGHVLPRVRARDEALSLFAIGSAGGADEQEGAALFAEEQSGLLDGARARELALRHRLVAGMRNGARFVDTVRSALAADIATDDAVALAFRLHRGAGADGEGLGREAAYVPAFRRILSAPADERRALARGQLSVGAIEKLAEAGIVNR